MTAAMGMPKFETGPQKSVERERERKCQRVMMVEDRSVGVRIRHTGRADIVQDWLRSDFGVER